MTPLNRPFFRIRSLCGLVSAVWILVSGCSIQQLPEIRQAIPGANSSIAKHCRSLFLQDNAQLVHSLEVRLPGKNTASVIGITNITPDDRALESVIMTIEGLVVFHARFITGKKEVLKSVKPFTSEQFSDGLLRDIQLIFLIPGGNLMQAGKTVSDLNICRYQNQNGNLVDILLQPDGTWNINQYNGRKQLIRSVAASQIDLTSNDPLTRYPKKMILESSGLFGYSLIMNLLRAEYTGETP